MQYIVKLAQTVLLNTTHPITNRRHKQLFLPEYSKREITHYIQSIFFSSGSL